MKRTSGSLAPEERGALFEGVVTRLVRANMDYRSIRDDICYGAPSGRSGTEVDCLLLRGLDLIALDAKSGSTFTDTWCKGLRAVENLKGLIRRNIVSRHGPVLKTKYGIDVFPLQHFSDLLAGSRL